MKSPSPPGTSSMRERFQALLAPTPPPPNQDEPVTFEDALTRILLRPADLGSETAQQAYARKEDELRAVFAGLPVIEAWNLHRRLSNPRAGDPLAAAFERLVIDRRTRLLAFLADARRRAAIADARRRG